MVSSLYEKHNYLNKNISYIINQEIIEYDIQSAGFNLIKYFKLVTNDKIQYLESLPRQHRQIQIGLYQKEDRTLIRRLNDAFKAARKLFFEANHIEDDDVISIKKDAIIMGRRCNKEKFDNISFREKNEYSSYYYLNKYEFYFNAYGVDVKGINDKLLLLHRDYMLDFLYNFFKMNETSPRKSVIRMIKDFSFYYKEQKLPIDYYRQLDSNSLFMLKQKYRNEMVGVKFIDDITKIETGYNYMQYVVPLISILV